MYKGPALGFEIKNDLQVLSVILIRQSKYKILFFIICYITWHLSSKSIHGIDGLGFQFQKFCVESVESLSEFDNLHKKVICSYDQTPMSSENEHTVFDLFKNLGLIHLLVASGAHLIIIQKGIQKILIQFTKSKRLTYVFLSLFILCSNFNCPVTRSYCQLVISIEGQKKSMGWSNIHITLISSSFYISLFPSTLFSLSFWLSLSASLCLSLFSKSTTTLAIGFYFGLLPFIFDFNWPSFSSIFVNVFITPWLSSLYIWNSMIYLFLKKYYLIGDNFYLITIHFLKYIASSSYVPMLFTHYTKLKTYKYIYGLCFLILSIYFQILKTNKIRNLINKNIQIN